MPYEWLVPVLRVRAGAVTTMPPRRAIPIGVAHRCLLVGISLTAVACPAPAIDYYYPYDATPFDARPGDGAIHNPLGAPSCSPEAVVDFNAQATRTGNLLTLAVDTRNARNDVHPACVLDDGPEVFLRYHVPPASERTVAGLRVSTVTDVTRANALRSDGTADPDPTTFDTVLSIRRICDGRDLACNNDDFLPNASTTAIRTRRSTVWQVGVMPEDELLIMLDGNEGSRGVAILTIEEIPQLGVLYMPCMPIPLERALDPTAPTAYFRCPAPGLRCGESAAGDGTDLCLPIVPLGAMCDEHGRINVCEGVDVGAVCASNPSDQTQVQCAMPGTAPGAPCRGNRTTVDRCVAGLFCSLATPGEGSDTCVPIRHQGESCDPTPTGSINHCADGLACCVFGDAGDETTCQPAGPACVRPPTM